MAKPTGGSGAIARGNEYPISSFHSDKLATTVIARFDSFVIPLTLTMGKALTCMRLAGYPYIVVLHSQRLLLQQARRLLYR
jgi:hypothetical protein